MPVFVSVTVAPGITAPVVSVIVPRMVPVTAWAASEPGSRHTGYDQETDYGSLHLRPPCAGDAARYNVDESEDAPSVDGDGPRGGDDGGHLAADERARHPLGRPGDADRGDHVAVWLRDRRRKAADALLAFLFVEAVAALADGAQLLQQTRRGGDGLRGQRRERLRRSPGRDFRLGPNASSVLPRLVQ